MGYGTFGQGSSSRQDLLNAINRINEGDDFGVDEVQSPLNTTGTWHGDFFGNLIFGATNEASWGAMSAYDAFGEGIHGDDYSSFHEMIAGDAAGSSYDMTGWGRAGLSIGSALGMVPQFLTGGFLAKQGIKQGAKIVSDPIAGAIKRSTDEIIDSVSKIKKPTGMPKDAFDSFTDDVASSYIENSYKLMRDGNALHKVDGAISREFLENTIDHKLKTSLAKIIKVADDDILSQISKETIDIISRNNPDDAMYILQNMFQRTKLPLLSGPHGSRISAAMAYDAAIGVAIGTQKAVAESFYKMNWGVERVGEIDKRMYGEPGQGEFAYTGDFDMSFGDFAQSWLHHAATDAYHFVLMGPASFIKGGTSASHMRRAGGIVSQSVKSYWKPINKMKRKELQAQLTAMNEISGGLLNRSLKKKYANEGANWWLKKGLDDQAKKAQTKLMRDMMGDIRKKFLFRAPLEWTKEFSRDILKSLPRMAAGVVAMNAPNLISTFRQNGLSLQSLQQAFGGTPQEISANIFTAMFFTRKPHSFHTPFTKESFNRVFETGKIKEYIDGKASKLRKITGGMRAWGMDIDKMPGLIQAYGSPLIDPSYRKQGDNIIKKTLDDTPEFKTIKEIFEPFEKISQNNIIPGADMKTAYHKHVKDMVDAGELTPSEAVMKYENYHIAERILDMYNKNSSGDTVNTESMTSAQAYEIVNKIATMRFDGEAPLTMADITGGKLGSWLDKKVVGATDAPVNLLKNYMKQLLDILGEPYEFEDGILKSNRITDIYDFGDMSIQETVATLYNSGVKNNWIVPGRAKASREGAGTIDGEMQKKIQDLQKEYTDYMMDLVYGENWRKITDRDDLILVNDVWSLTYNNILKHKQRVEAYEVLTGGKEHSFDINQVNTVNDFINNFFLFRNTPDISKLDVSGKSVNESDFGEVKLFIDNFHRVVKDLNPTITERGYKNLTYEEAVNLRNFVMGDAGKGGMFGDLFRDPYVLKQFREFIEVKSLDKLSSYDLASGIDNLSSVNYLIKDINFNLSESGRNPVFPDMIDVTAAIQSEVRGNRLDEAYGKELIEHYETIVGSINKSKFPVEFSSNLEISNTDIVLSLRKSLTSGKMAMDRFMNDSANQLRDLLEVEIDKSNAIVQNIEMGLAGLDPKARDAARLEMQDFIDARTEVIRLNEIIKKAITDRDPYTLRSVAKVNGDIHSLIKAFNTSPLTSKRAQYIKEVGKIIEKIDDNTTKEVFNEQGLKDFIAEELKVFADRIPDKDVESRLTRVTTVQFAAKYKIPIKELNSLLDFSKQSDKSADDIRSFAKQILGDVYENSQLAPSTSSRIKVDEIVSSLNKLAGDIILDVSTDVGRANFNAFVLDPVKARVEIARETMTPEQRRKIPITEMDADIYNIVSNAFSKKSVKSFRVDLRNNRLILENRIVGRAENRGFLGILKQLDPSQTNIYLLSNSGTNLDGKKISNTGTMIGDINDALLSGNFTPYSPGAKKSFYEKDSAQDLYDVNRTPSQSVGERFYAVQLNEKTSVVIRVDKNMNSIKTQIDRAFRPSDKLKNDPGGEMYRKIEAIYDGDLAINSPKHKVMRDFLRRIQNENSPEAIGEAIKLVRMLNNMAAYIPDVLTAKGIDLKHERVLELWKRDNLNEAKNGYVPTVENRMKSGIVYSQSQSKLFRDMYEGVSDWFENPDKKMKVVSIDDGGNLKDADGNILLNVFSAIDKKKAMLNKKLNDGDITPEEHKMNLELLEKSTKEVTDAEFFLTKEAYTAQMMFLGLHPDMITDNLQGFNVGGIKPTISHSSVDVASGRVETFYAKTAFKYDPIIADIIASIGADGLTFKSANKLNSIKDGAGRDVVDRYVTPKGIKDEAAFINTVWPEHLDNTKGSMMLKDNIIEIPLDAFSIRNVSMVKDKITVSSNLAVHFNGDGGISNWIGADARLDVFNSQLSRSYTNAYHRTALAKSIFGERAMDGDPIALNSAMNSILQRDGLILEPWALRRLEDNMLGYFINNGNLGQGSVTHGSIDVMSADWGDLATPIRSKLNENNVVKYYGEYQPSYNASQKTFIGKESINSSDNVQNIIIQRINYKSGKETRKADAFVVDIQGESFVVVEGRMINKKGDLLNPDTFRVIEKGTNKDTFEKILEINDNLMNKHDGRTINDVAVELSYSDQKWDGQFSSELAVGTLNSRQPRNMIGDIVISRIAVRNGKAHVGENNGNVSRMNYVDAIKPQDSDFDMDKTFNYTNAPGLFYREVGKNAGHITDLTSREVVMDIFDPNMNTGYFAKTVPDLLRVNARDVTHNEVFRQVDMARGQFIKMHQTLSHLSNMFRERDIIMEFDTNKFTVGGTVQVRLANKGKYIEAVENVSNMAKLFIDSYKELPSQMSLNNLQRIKNEILFGKDGIFELVRFDEKGREIVLDQSNFNLYQPEFAHVMNAVNKRFISPLNQYLRYNKGTEVMDTGQEVKAKMYDYHKAYTNLLEMSTNKYNQSGIGRGIRMDAGFETVARYLNESRNPYDVAVKEIHSIYNNRNTLKQQGNYGRTTNSLKEIQDYIDFGLDRVSGNPEEAHNRIFNSALREYVKDEFRMLRLMDLKNQETSLKIQLEKADRFKKTGEESTEFDLIQSKLRRTSELRESMEEVLSYKFIKDKDTDPLFMPSTIRHSGYGKGTYFNSGKPVVIVDAKGKIKEVVLSGARNVNNISSRDKMIINGRRFEITDGEVQKGLATLHEAYAGIPAIRTNDGNIIRLDHLELQSVVKTEYNRAIQEIMALEKQRKADKNTPEAMQEFIMERDRVISESIFKTFEGNEAYQQALILRFLTPSISNRVISVRSSNVGNSKRALYDYMYMENPMSEPVMSILSKIAAGEYIGDKQFAKDILDNVNVIKNAAAIAKDNPNISFELVHSRMITEPAEINSGFMGSDMYLNQGIFEMSRTGNTMERQAAKTLIDYATDPSKQMIDPIILYKASRVMEAAGIKITDQFIMKQNVSNPDGSVREFGVKQYKISEVDKLKRKDLGEMGGTQESVLERMKNIYDCLGIN